MDDHIPSGTQAAALLQPHQEHAARRRNDAAPDKQVAHHDTPRFGRPSALTVQQQGPVVHTDQFRVVEPDGSEDPGAGADDGLLPGTRDAQFGR